MMRIALFTVAAFAVAAAAPPSRDQLLKIMHDRHDGMEAIGKAAKAIGRELQGGSPDATVIRDSAVRIRELSHEASNWFPQGSGPELGKTGAKPEIWQNQKDFAIKLHNFQVASVQFSSAVADNDPTAIKARFADLGGACKACHDKYRTEMHH